MVSERLTSLWPAAGVRVRAGDLELRWIDDGLLAEVAELASRGVHDDGEMPFIFPWTRGTPEEVARSVVAFQWASRAQIGADEVRLELCALLDGRPVGVQGASGSQWRVLREVETGSWLGREHQGKGVGKRMRALMLHLLFEGLGAEHVTSAAFADNVRSNAVSIATGYLADGQKRVVREGASAIQNRFRMTRDHWLTLREQHAALLGAPVEMSDLTALREQLG
jgi:RimJ/RimL family protein N-acetyltransferase